VDVGDVSDPGFVGCALRELAIEAVGRDSVIVLAVGGANLVFAPQFALQTKPPHLFAHAFVIDYKAQFA